MTNPAAIPAIPMDWIESGLLRRRCTLPYTPKQIAFIAATPANGEDMPR
jgi:hypothetical protein